MKQKIIKIILLVVIIISSVLLFISINEKPPIIDNLVALDVKDDLGLPIRLKIPQISVDANIEYVGLTSLGAMDVPAGPDDVAWFELGPYPGEKGSSVIAGHSGWKNKIPAVFDNLNELKIGDKIYIEDKKGEVITFVVSKIKTYDPKADTKEVFGSDDGKSHLNLITCAGTWDETSKSSSERLVVFTDRE